MNEDHVLADTRECGHAQTLPPQPKVSIHIIRRWLGFFIFKLTFKFMQHIVHTFQEFFFLEQLKENLFWFAHWL